MRSIKIRQSVALNDLYVKVTCLRCGEQQRCHLRKPTTAKRCEFCAMATYYITVTPIPGRIVFTVIWHGTPGQEAEIDVDTVEIGDQEVYNKDGLVDQS